MNLCAVITTCPDEASAERLAEAVVGARLAACVNIIPGIVSVYEWKGERVKDREWLLLMKTRTDTYPRLEAFIQDHHPYEVPEVVALPVQEASSAYCSWVSSQVEKEL